MIEYLGALLVVCGSLLKGLDMYLKSEIKGLTKDNRELKEDKKELIQALKSKI